MTNPEWMERFLEDCVFRGCCENTLAAYRGRLTVFFDYIEDITVTDIRRGDCMDFLGELSENMSASSVMSYITTLRSFGTFIEADLWEDEGWRNVFATLRYPKTEQFFPKILTREEVDTMISHMSQRTATQRRDRALPLSVGVGCRTFSMDRGRSGP